MKKRNKKGFTLIELLIVVAIIGIIVAIAIPNLLNAIQRAKQKRTMGDMRTAGTAAEAYAVDFNHYPAAAGYTLPSGFSSPTGTFGQPSPPSGFSLQVTPTYIRLLPSRTAGTRSSCMTAAARTTSSCRTARTERTKPRRRSARRRTSMTTSSSSTASSSSTPRARRTNRPPSASRSKSPLDRGLFSFPSLESLRCKAA